MTRFFLALLVFIVQTPWIFAQLASPFAAQKVFPQIPLLEFGVDKNVNTYLFNSRLSGRFPFGAGIMDVDAQYAGRAIRGNVLSVRDAGDAFLQYTYPLTKRLALLASQTAFVSSDSRSDQSNRSTQFTSYGGVGYTPIPQLDVRVRGGGEFNEELNIVDRGWGIVGESVMQPIAYDDYIFDAQAFGKFSQLSNQRTNAESLIDGSIRRSFEDGGALNVNIRNTRSRREFYATGSSGFSNATASALTLETYDEQRWNFFGQFLIPAGDNTDFQLDAEFGSGSIDRFFAEPLQDAINTAVTKTRDEQRIFFQGSALFGWLSGRHSIGLAQESRDEINNVARRFTISDGELSNLRSQEDQRNNTSSRTSLFFSSRWDLFTNDTVGYKFSSRLLRYDTPSEVNNDDRDELSFVINGWYTHRFSPLLEARLAVDFRAIHLVFVKSARSAQNNWNRIIRLEPSFRISTKNFSAHPQFEVLANFTAYDFDNVVNAPQSFSFRQIGYRDSIAIRLSPTNWIESRITFRYFERGELQWESFSETPQNKNYEQFTRLIYFSAPESTLKFGFGGRYYALWEKQLTALSNDNSPFLRQSLAPEAIIEATFVNGATIRFNGWYEFNFENGVDVRQIPNITMQAALEL